MKKIISILLCIALLLGMTAAFAETAATAATEAPKTAETPETTEKEELGTINVNGSFTLKSKLPEGFKARILQVNSDIGFLIAEIRSEDPTKPLMDLYVFYSDNDYSKLERLNDATDEQLAELEDTFREEDLVDITYTETGLGTKLMVVKEVEDSTDFVSIFTIYKGYCVEFMLEPNTKDNPDAILTDEQIQMAINSLTDLDFVPNA